MNFTMESILTNVAVPFIIGVIIGKTSRFRSKKCTHDFHLISKDVVDSDKVGGIMHTRYSITMNCRKCGQTRVVDTARGDINVYE